ncbi:helix-turn-helix transcriptional regulator [Gracilibacillus sp. S3-1-1]|uniref:Helix-turn-helix transcriptional regulator n=1 Tax=Gracilibacillus pellucidus TaxID=3095368 RepID=A0ACC6M3U6_9BACI|nr:helix-turn-helix transcriptional regulator [Gracilibacillus sp. S3-1-1]MDX8045643.1 helix-turn-helix transcriptional regulator [Gracilibacillus sp. S3-1-1]
MLKNRLVVYRAEKGWTQQKLADRVNVSRQTIANIERNKYTPSVTLAFKIAYAFNVKITDVFLYSEEE